MLGGCAASNVATQRPASRRQQRERRGVEDRPGGPRCAGRAGSIDGHRFGERAHPRVLELDDLALRVRFELAKHVEHALRIRPAQPLHGLKRAVRRAAQVRVQASARSYDREGAGEVPLLEPALRRRNTRRRRRRDRARRRR